jgi:hypothetical protein
LFLLRYFSLKHFFGANSKTGTPQAWEQAISPSGKSVLARVRVFFILIRNASGQSITAYIVSNSGED